MPRRAAAERPHRGSSASRASAGDGRPAGRRGRAADPRALRRARRRSRPRARHGRHGRCLGPELAGVVREPDPRRRTPAGRFR